MSRSKPANVEVRIRVSLEYQFAGCIEFSDNEELLFAGFRRNHGFVLFFSHLIISFLNIYKIAFAIRNATAG